MTEDAARREVTVTPEQYGALTDLAIECHGFTYDERKWMEGIRRILGDGLWFEATSRAAAKLPPLRVHVVVDWDVHRRRRAERLEAWMAGKSWGDL